LKRAVKELTKLDEERTERLLEANAQADRQVVQVKEAASDLVRICADPELAKQCFSLTKRMEIEENEFNLNLPRYIDTFDRRSGSTSARPSKDLEMRRIQNKTLRNACTNC